MHFWEDDEHASNDLEALRMEFCTRTPLRGYERWEDQERGVWDVETLRKEFRKRLYGNEETMTEQTDIEKLEILASQLNEAHEAVKSQIKAKRMEQLPVLDMLDLTWLFAYDGALTGFFHGRKAAMWYGSSNGMEAAPLSFLDERGLSATRDGCYVYVIYREDCAEAFQKLVRDIHSASLWVDSEYVKPVEERLKGLFEGAAARLKKMQLEVEGATSRLKKVQLEVDRYGNALEVFEPAKPQTWEEFQESLRRDLTQPLPDKLDFGGEGDEGTWRMVKGVSLMGAEGRVEAFFMSAGSSALLCETAARERLREWAIGSDWPVALFREEKDGYAKLVWDARDKVAIANKKQRREWG